MRKVFFKDLGLIDFKEAWDYQSKIFQETIDVKISNRSGTAALAETKNLLLFCEHPHVYTLGNSGDHKNLLISEEHLQQNGASFYKINRGGDITYHGPGQLVCYPIFDLDHFFTDIHKYLRFVEEAVILTLGEYGVKGGRFPGHTGVWIDPDDPINARKICAMGVKCSRWVTMHGLGFNVNSDLTYFSNIIPCGIDGKKVTSIQLETGSEVSMADVKEKLKTNLANVFEFNYG